MDKKYSGYCGLYCENCAVKAKVQPASKNLYDEMKKAGYEEFIEYIPEGTGFWTFLKNMALEGTCRSCREGSGNPGCTIRKCAEQKGVEMCAFCDSYPCEAFTIFFEGYPILKEDNALLREKGMDAWLAMQDERRSKGWTYSG